MVVQSAKKGNLKITFSGETSNLTVGIHACIFSFGRMTNQAAAVGFVDPGKFAGGSHPVFCTLTPVN
jgi:hypothetical protein